MIRKQSPNRAHIVGDRRVGFGTRPTQQPRGPHALGQINCEDPASRRAGGSTVISRKWATALCKKAVPSPPQDKPSHARTKKIIKDNTQNEQTH